MTAVVVVVLVKTVVVYAERISRVIPPASADGLTALADMLEALAEESVKLLRPQDGLL